MSGALVCNGQPDGKAGRCASICFNDGMLQRPLAALTCIDTYAALRIGDPHVSVTHTSPMLIVTLSPPGSITCARRRVRKLHRCPHAQLILASRATYPSAPMTLREAVSVLLLLRGRAGSRRS